MIYNYLDLDRKGVDLHVGQLLQHLTMENDFLVNHCSVPDTPYVFSNKNDLERYTGTLRIHLYDLPTSYKEEPARNT